MDPVGTSLHTPVNLQISVISHPSTKASPEEHFSVLAINTMKLKFAWRKFPGSPVVRT